MKPKPSAIFVKKNPATWKCSECGKQFGPIEPGAGATPEVYAELFVELERDFHKQVEEACGARGK